MGDDTLVPFTGLATVISAAKAGLEHSTPEKMARMTRANHFGVWRK
jgi:hypothetical protein